MSVHVGWKPIVVSVAVGFAAGFFLVWNAIL